MSPTVWIVTALALLTAGAIVGAVALPFASILVPAAKRLAAPFVCPDGTDHSVVVQRIRHSGPGKTSFSSDLYCVDAHRGRKEMDGWRELVGMAAAGAAGGAGLALLVPVGLLLAGVRRSSTEVSR